RESPRREGEGPGRAAPGNRGLGAPGTPARIQPAAAQRPADRRGGGPPREDGAVTPADTCAPAARRRAYARARQCTVRVPAPAVRRTAPTGHAGHRPGELPATAHLR